MIYGKAYDPCSKELEQQDPEGSFPTSKFPVDCSDRCSARNIQKAEDHEGIGVGGAKAKPSQSGHHGIHAVCSCDILDAEQDAAA